VSLCLLLEPAIERIGKAFNSQRRHIGSVVVPEWNLIPSYSWVKKATA
jgi:hypothetical protein